MTHGCEWNCIWNVLGREPVDEDASEESVWMHMENCFNTISRSILVLHPVKPYLRLVLDDDKVHCESGKKGVWDSIKRMKHVVCNRFGLTIHTLASSCTGLIYGVRTQRTEDTRVG